MNPFSGFVQAVTGLMPGFGDKTGNIGKGLQGLPVGDDTISSADENTRSFLAWVHNFMDNAAGADAGGEGVFTFQPSHFDPDMSALDQLQALMAEATDLLPQDRPAAHLPNGGSLDNGHVPLPQGIINAIIAHHEHSHVADMPAHEAMPDIPRMMAAMENTPSDGQAPTAGNGPGLQKAVTGVPAQAGEADGRQRKVDLPAVGQTTQAADKGTPFQAAVTGIPAQVGEADERQRIVDMPAVGQTTQAADKGTPFQAAVTGIPAQAGTVDDNPIKKSPPEWVMMKNRPEEGFEKGHASTNRLIQERWPANPGVAEKANDPVPPQLQAVSGQTKDPASMVTGLTGQGSAPSADDGADFRGKDPHQPAPRVELAHDNEKEWQKGDSSDAVKGTGAEQTKSQPAFQDTAKAMAGDQPLNTTVKPVAGQAAALTRTEDAAVKTFQTSVMDQIVDKAAMRSIHGRSEIQIRLKPEFLGNVQMNIAADKEQLVVRIITDRPVVKEIIETHLHHLKTELQNQGLTIDKFEVMVNPDGNQQHSRDQFAGMFKHHFSQNNRRQQHGQDPETSNRDGGNNPDDVRPNRDGVNYFA